MFPPNNLHYNLSSFRSLVATRIVYQYLHHIVTGSFLCFRPLFIWLSFTSHRYFGFNSCFSDCVLASLNKPVLDLAMYSQTLLIACKFKLHRVFCCCCLCWHEMLNTILASSGLSFPVHFLHTSNVWKDIQTVF
jgi:hypothetical protein